MSHLIVGDNSETKFIKKEPFETCFVVEPRFLQSANFIKNVNTQEISTCHLCNRAEKLLRALYKHIQANHPDDGSETMKICSDHCAVGKMIQAEIVDHLMSLFISYETSSMTLETCEECTRHTSTEINATSLCPGGIKHQNSLLNHFKTNHITDFKLYNEQSTAMTRCFCSDGLIIQADLMNHLLAHLVGFNEIDWIKQEEKVVEEFEDNIEKMPIISLKRSISYQSFGNDWQEDQGDNDDFLFEENVKKARCLTDEIGVIMNPKLNEDVKLSAETRIVISRCDLRSNKSKTSHSGDNDCKLENGEIHCLVCSYYCLSRKLFRNHWDKMHAPNILSSFDNQTNENRQLYREVSIMAKDHPGDNDFTRENMKLQCTFCSYHCWNKKYYRKHWNAMHDPNNPNKRVHEEVKDHPGDKDYRRDKQKILCLLCPYQCYNKKYYRKHWDAVHRSNDSSSQDDSQIVEEIKEELFNTDQEYQEQNDEKVYSTSEVAKDHPGDKDYKREHMKLECLLCNYHCWNKKYYRRHWNAMHDPNNTTSQAQAQVSEEGNELLRQVHKERDESVSQNKSLSEKLKNHPGDNDYIRENMRLECLLCNYHCWNKQNYRKHWDSTHDPNSSVSQSRFRIQLRSEKHPGDNDYERGKEKQKLQCKLCSWYCYNKMRYRIHWESAHDPLNPNRRPQKNTKLQQRDHPAYNFCQHQDDRYYCLMCPFIVKTRAEYRDHWEAEHDESSSTLQKIDKSESRPSDNELDFNDTIEIDLPSMSENLYQKLSCDLCGFQSYTLDIMNYHIHHKHSNVKSPKEKEDRSVVEFLFHKNEDNQYVCDHPECGRTYINKNKLRVHQRVVHSKVMCDKCSKWVIARSLSIHFQINHGAEKSIKCDFKGCKASFVRKSDYLAHMSSKHEGKKLFKCEQCEKEFSHKASLNSHVTYTHVKPEKLRCQICQLKLSTLQGFRLHMRTHTDDSRLRPFACDHPQCDKSFKYSDHLAQHRRVCHTENGRLKKKANAVSFMKNHPNYSREYYENKKYKAKN